MKKFLEALVDNNGHLTLYTDFHFYDSAFNRAPSYAAAKKENDRYNRMMIEGMVPALWRDRNYDVSKAIRYLSMAEVISCAEPYDNAGHLWCALTSDYIPHYERLADRLKKPYGYHPVFSPDSFPPSGLPFPFPGFGNQGGKNS